MKISRIMFIVMLFLFSCSMVAFSQDMEAAEMKKSNSGIQLGKAIVVTATVEAINANERKVVLRSDSGKVQVVEVGPEVKNFDQVAIGDKVRAEYYQSVAVHIGAPGEIPEETVGAVRITAAEGEKPELLEIDVVDVIATASKIDRENRMITLIGPEGNSVTAKVDPRVGNMENIKEGDRLHIRYTDAVAISVSEQ